MNIVKPSIEVLSEVNGVDILKRIEAYGRTAYKSEGYTTNNSCYEFVEKLINKGHESVLEHVSLTVKFITDRGVSHEIVRHRIASYTQESTRYCNYASDDISFIMPPMQEKTLFDAPKIRWELVEKRSAIKNFLINSVIKYKMVRLDPGCEEIFGLSKSGFYSIIKDLKASGYASVIIYDKHDIGDILSRRKAIRVIIDKDNNRKDVYKNRANLVSINELVLPDNIFDQDKTSATTSECVIMDTYKVIEEAYKKLLEIGVEPQIARYILPNGLKTELVMTANLREWRHFIKLRASKAAHPAIRSLAVDLLRQLQELVPVIFDDLWEFVDK